MTSNTDIAYICSVPPVARLNLLAARQYTGESDCFFEYVPDGAIARIQIGDIDLIGFPAHTKSGHKAFSKSINGGKLSEFLQEHHGAILDDNTAVNFGIDKNDLYLAVGAVVQRLTAQTADIENSTGEEADAKAGYALETECANELLGDIEVSAFMSKLSFGSVLSKTDIAGRVMSLTIAVSANKIDTYTIDLGTDGTTLTVKHGARTYEFRSRGLELLFSIFNLAKG